MSSPETRSLKQVVTVPASSLPPLGTSGLEPRIAAGEAFGDLEGQTPRIADCWIRTWPGLDEYIAAAPVTGKPTKICIATDDIVGPTRNGGIGTTYSALADLLAGMGLNVTIAYLKGSEVENGTIDHWIDHYARRNIAFIPVPNVAARDGLETEGENCLSASYNLMHFLLANPMHVVHVSEWRGAGFLSLTAKRQGLAFRGTTFVVKASSPWLWDRLYGLQPLQQASDLLQMHAERVSIEAADIVVGGSAHLLRFMSSQGYRLPPSRTFVQPNVIDLSALAHVPRRAALAPGVRLKVSEFVFFGRLEGRKGLAEFIAAINRMIRRGDTLPSAVTFLGKPGLPLAERPGLPVIAYLREATAAWPMPVEILTSMPQAEALHYLLSGPRLAVMPSRIENSSLVVYEAALCGIPFIASNAGGNPELIDDRDCAEALVEPHPVPLADRLGAVLRDGAVIPRPAFSNDDNLETWRNFHRHLPIVGPPQAKDETTTPVAVLIYAENAGTLDATLADLEAQDNFSGEVVIGLADDHPQAFKAASENTARHANLRISIVDVTDCGIGLAINLMRDRAQADVLLCVQSGTRLARDAVATIGRAAASTGADLITFFYRSFASDDTTPPASLRASFPGADGLTFFAKDFSFVPFAMRRARIAEGLAPAPDSAPGGIVQELAGRANILGFRCETIPVELASIPAKGSLRRAESTTAAMVAARPYLAAAPLALRAILMRAQGLHVANTASRDSSGRIARRQAGLVQARRYNSTIRVPRRLEAARPDGDGRFGDSAGPLDIVRRAMHALPVEACPRDNDGTMGGSSFTGALLAVRSSEIFGWVRDELRPERKVKLEARMGDASIECVAGDVRIASFQPMRRDILDYSFRIRVPKKLRTQNVKIQIAGAAPWVEMQLPGYGDTLESLGYQGWCDWIDADRINGWIWRPAHPSDRVAVAVFIDGQFHVRVPAELHRHDLRAAGIGCGDYAFSIPVPSAAIASSSWFDVVVADTGLLLRRGRKRLTDGRWQNSFAERVRRWR